MNIINWGIIGCGNVTEVKSGPAFNKVPDSRLIAVMRRDEQKVKDYALRHAVPKWYTNARDLINDPEINAVYVATPPLQHEEYAIMSLEAGKPVYLEKPMAINVRSAQRIADAAKRTGIKLSIAHYRRQQPLFLKIKKLLDENTIGDIRLVDLQLLLPHRAKMITQTPDAWRLDPAISGGGLFHDLSPHQLDLMIYFFGNIKAAKGMAHNNAALYEADDTVSGQILFNNGILFSGVWSFVVPETEKRDFCEIIGSMGKISFSIFELKPFTVSIKDKVDIISFEALPHVQQPMIAKVVQYFLGKAPNPCSPEEGVEVMHVMEAFTKNSGRQHTI